MPTQAKIVSGLFVAVVVAVLFVGWVGWPGFLSVATGALFGLAFMIIATSLGADPRAADAAWRSRATDLMGAYAGSENDLVQLPPYGPVPEGAGTGAAVPTGVDIQAAVPDADAASDAGAAREPGPEQASGPGRGSEDGRPGESGSEPE